jgi:chromosome segregation ATPase
MPPIPLEDLEAMILDELRARPGQLVDRVREAVEQVFADRDATIARLEEAEREVATLAVQHARLDRDLRVIDDERDRRQLLRILGDIDAEAAAASAQVEQLRARADEHAASAIDDLDSAVTDAMKRIAETISDTDRIETARNVIRQAWPQIVAHYNGATLRVDTGQVSPDFVASLGDLVAVP